MGFMSVLSFAQALVKERVQQGETVIDATVGGGVDTLFLLRVVGVKGRVYGFDVQQAALDAAQRRIASEPAVQSHAGSLVLTLRSHDEMEAVIPPTSHGMIGAVMFNLGYLPGAEQTIITRAVTTLPALDAALRLLRRGGVVTVVVYPGHEGGGSEAAAVEQWAQALPQAAYQVLTYRFSNRSSTAPYLIAIEKKC